MKILNNDTKIFALGGLGEVGKNTYGIMHNDEIIIIDAGVMFPKDELMGIDYVIPDYTFLKENRNKVKALIITHGHEDHIGGIPFLLNTIDIPTIWAPNQASALIRKKLSERRINYKNLKTYTDKTIIKTKYFSIEFFKTNHSIPDSHGMAITGPNGTIVATGDFKFDLTPVGPLADIHKMAEIGKKGVTLMLSDSTNSMNEGFSKSESIVDDALSEMIPTIKGRVIIATFASNIYRLKHIVETCEKTNRKVTVFGRSMGNSIEIAKENGYIKNTDIFITAEEANKLPDIEVAILCTGSQGETLAALTRISNGTHKQMSLRPDDVVIFSSSPIPGNGASVSRTINNLYLKGVKVYNNAVMEDVHASGHAYAEELKLMLRLINPKFFMPVHGEYRMLKAHADLAIECGIPKNNIFICENGSTLSMTRNNVKRSSNIKAADVYVDGNRVGDIGNAIINDRRIMSDDGILVIIANFNVEKNMLIGNPNITTRGFIHIAESMDFVKKLERVAKKAIINSIKNKINYNDTKTALTSTMNKFVYKETGRSPLILPVIMNVKR